MSNIGTYAYFNAKIRAKLSDLLKDTDISSLIRADGMENFLTQLQQYGYYSFLKSANVEDDDGFSLNRILENLLVHDFQNKMFDLSRCMGSFFLKNILRNLMRSFEIDNLKKVLSHVFFGKPINLVYNINIGTFSPDELVKAGTPDELMLKLKNTEYYEVMIKSFSQFATTQTLFYMFLDLDRYYFKCLYNALMKADLGDRHILKNVFDALSDINNLQAYIRLHHFYSVPSFELLSCLIPYGKVYEYFKKSTSLVMTDVLGLLQVKNSSFAPRINEALDPGAQAILLDDLLDEVLIEVTKKALAQDPFAIGIFVAFYFLKQRELQRVVTILNGKFYKLPEDRIREML